jgi:hypothetical protein
MGLFRRKDADQKPGGLNDVYSFSGVTQDNETARSIQHNVDLLHYLAGNKRLNRDKLATYLEMCERFGMGTHPQKAQLLAASATMSAAQATAIRQGLANVHVEALTSSVRALRAATQSMETVKMIEYIVNETDAIQKHFV